MLQFYCKPMAFAIPAGQLSINTSAGPYSTPQGVLFNLPMTAVGGSGGNVWTVLTSTGGDTWVFNGNVLSTTPGQGLLSTEAGNNLVTEAGNNLVS